MNKKNGLSKKIVLSLAIAGITVFAALFYFLSVSGKKTGNSPDILLMIIILAVLAILSSIYVYFRNMDKTKKLTAEFRNEYEYMSDRIDNIVLSRMEKKEVLEDILSIFIQAQKDNRQVLEVVGENSDVFIKNIISSFGYRSSFLFNLLNGSITAIAYVFLVQMFSWIDEAGSVGFFEVKSDYEILLFLIPFAFIVVPSMTHLIKKSRLLIAVIIPVFAFAMIVGGIELLDVLFGDSDFVEILLGGQGKFIGSFAVLAAYLTAVGIFAGLKTFLRRKSIKEL